MRRVRHSDADIRAASAYVPPHDAADAVRSTAGLRQSAGRHHAIKTETERRKHEKAEKQAKDDEEERKRQQIFGPLDKLKAAIRSRRKRKSLPIAALTAPVDEEQDGNVENATEPECSDEPAPDAAPEREPGADVEPEDAPAIEPDEVEDGEYAGMGQVLPD